MLVAAALRPHADNPPGQGQPVLDRVVHQLGDHHGQRCGILGPQPTERPAAFGPHRHITGSDLDHGGQPAGRDLVEVHRLVEALAQGVVDQRDDAHPAYRLIERSARLVVGKPA